MPGTKRLPYAELEIESTIAGTKRLHGWLDEVLREAGVPEKPAHAVRLCLEEAVMNIVLHGYPESAPGPIELALWRAPPGLRACVADRAPPFDPVTAPVPDAADRLAMGRPGGRGLRLIRQFATEQRYERDAGRNRLLLGFAI